MLSCLIFFKTNLALFEPFMILRDEVTQTLVLFDSLIQMGQKQVTSDHNALLIPIPVTLQSV